MAHIKTLSLSLLALGLCLACQEKSDNNAQPTPQAGSGAVSGAPTTPKGGADAGGAAGTPDEVPVRKGERGTSCDSTNDCEEGLSCLVTHDCPNGVACANKSCQPSNFDLTGTGKTCHIKECKTKADCCGEKPLKAPDKCANRESICNRPTLTGCTTSLACTSSSACGTGKCEGYCNYSTTTTKCTTATDCPVNVCNTTTSGTTTSKICSLSSTDCSTTTCVANTCYSPRCNCTNPEYAPTNAICTDPDCLGICGYTCTDDRCVADTTCNSDIQCTTATPFCSSGKCSQCRTSADCKDEECIEGHCGPACKSDTQCALFEACKTGKCVFVGCQSDRECVLQARASTSPVTQDPRLAKCRIEKNVGTCVFPCEIDAQCASTEVCVDNVCKYIGCETDGECATIAGLHNQPIPTPDRPWTTTAVCEAEDAATP